MRRFIYAILILIGSGISANATVLFPYFVDIAPDYKDGLSEELQAAGVPCGMYHSTKPDFLVSTISKVESFLQDTLPSDVTRSEKKVNDCLLIIYTSINRKEDDTIETTPLQSTIYILGRPDNSYVAAYCEEEVED